MNIVVGSGPAGIACASALIEMGGEVTLLDVGVRCEPDRLALVERLRSTPIEEWDPSERALISQLDHDPKRKFALKLVYGSSFPYASAEASGLTHEGVQCWQSWAEGGLSNVWGAAMLAFKPADISEWPISHDELVPHYRAIARITGMAGVHDALESEFPYYEPPLDLPDPSRQAEMLLRRLGRNEETLRAQGLRFGRSRLALSRKACRGCQLCLTGCPYDAIYRTSHTMAQLSAGGKFRYVPGQHVLRCERDGEGAVGVICRDREGKTSRYRGGRVFVAAGAIGTAKIALASLGQRHGELPLRYHPYFFAPALLSEGFQGLAREKLYALAQVFLELDNPDITDRGTHLQIYTYTPIYADRLARGGWLGALAGRALLPRLVVIQGYLHSHETDPIRVRFDVDDATGEYRMRLSAELGANALEVMRRIARFLRKNAWRTGLFPVPFAMKPGNPGDGNHVGASFPMSRDPSGFQTDTLGRLAGLELVHLVDASVLPSLPPRTLTFTAMANAHRVGSIAARLTQA